LRYFFAYPKRETSKLLNNWKANENLKVVDFIHERNIAMDKLGQKSNAWYDEEE
jgi:hypothetical protein